MLGQWIATSMSQVTQTFLVYYLTGSAAILGITALATGLPLVILLLFGGALADRFPKKRLLQFGQIGGALCALLIVIALMTGYLSKDNPGSWWLVVFTSVITGISNGMAFPARQAMIGEIAPGDQLMNAVALASMGQQICTLAGPSVAGFLIAGVGFTWVYLAMALLYVMAVILTNFLPAKKSTGVKVRAGSTFKDVIEGLRYVGSQKIILMVIVFNLACIFLSMPRSQLMPIFATDILHVGSEGQGILQSVGAVGSLIAAFFYATLPPKKRGMMILTAGITLSLALTVFAFSRSYALSIAMMVLMGIGQTGHSQMAVILVQTLADKEHVGRAMSILQMGGATANLGTFVVGVIAQFAGVQWTMGVMGMILFLAAISSLLFLTQLRKLD
jgi:MFS family permease